MTKSLSKGSVLKSGWMYINPTEARVIDTNAMVESKLKELSFKLAAETEGDAGFTEGFVQGIKAEQVTELIGEGLEPISEEAENAIPESELLLQQAQEEIENMKAQALAEIEEARVQVIEEAKKNTITTFEELVKKAQELSIVRKANAKLLKENIMKTLTDLCLDKVQMEIVFNDVDYNSFENSAIFKDNGVDEIDFLVSFNPGESLKPLSKVASGGEMSRVMLAFKTHILENVCLSTIIFDEIDTGISGEVANAVAVKLKAISKKTQVLSITHLPIVASAADQHLFVKKKVVNDRTVTSITKLSKEERIKEIATMISSQKDEITSQLLAESMIDKFCK